MKTTFNFDPWATMTLAELPVGRDAVVIEVDASRAPGRRLQDLGLLPQTPIRAVRRAPLGDPTVYEFRGTQLCLRRSEARRIRVAAGARKDGAEADDG